MSPEPTTVNITLRIRWRSILIWGLSLLPLVVLFATAASSNTFRTLIQLHTLEARLANRLLERPGRGLVVLVLALVLELVDGIQSFTLLLGLLLLSLRLGHLRELANCLLLLALLNFSRLALLVEQHLLDLGHMRIGLDGLCVEIQWSLERNLELFEAIQGLLGSCQCGGIAVVVEKMEQ